MQTRLRCKHASMSHGSLNVDLTIDENLALKSPHHYLVKLCKTPLMSLRLDSHPKVSSLHLRLACITVVPTTNTYNIYLELITHDENISKNIIIKHS
jgi:hypothetical protein